MLKKNSTVARVKRFYVACSKIGFLSWTMKYDQRQLLAQFRSTSKSGISPGAFLVVLHKKTTMYAFPVRKELGAAEIGLGRQDGFYLRNAFRAAGVRVLSIQNVLGPVLIMI